MPTSGGMIAAMTQPPSTHVAHEDGHFPLTYVVRDVGRRQMTYVICDKGGRQIGRASYPIKNGDEAAALESAKAEAERQVKLRLSRRSLRKRKRT